MYKKLIVPVFVAFVATVGLTGGTAAAVDMSVAEFDQNNNKAVVEITCDSTTLGISQNMPRADWLRSFYVGGVNLPADGSVADLSDPNLVDLLPGVVHERTVDSENVMVHYFSGNRDNMAPPTWQANQGWVPVETTVVNMVEDCPVPAEGTTPTTTQTAATKQVEKVPAEGVNAGAGTIATSLVALGGSLAGLGYGVVRLRKN